MKAYFFTALANLISKKTCGSAVISAPIQTRS